MSDLERILYRMAYGMVSENIHVDDSYLKNLANEIYNIHYTCYKLRHMIHRVRPQIPSLTKVNIMNMLQALMML